ncbi:MAG: hypothetical protein RL344_141, partial [Pseudomonadota bacterium]
MSNSFSAQFHCLHSAIKLMIRITSHNIFFLLLKYILVCTLLIAANTYSVQAQVCSNQGAANSQDFDCDGVINSIDLDDDNDGILDGRECGIGTDVLVNASFENPVQTTTGNNIKPIREAFGSWNIIGTGGFNVVKGPVNNVNKPRFGQNESSQYIEIASGTSKFGQTFVAPLTGKYSFGGYYSTWEKGSANYFNWAGQMWVLTGTSLAPNAANTLATTNILSFDSTTPVEWKLVSGTVTLTAGQTYTLVGGMGNFGAFDSAFLNKIACDDTDNDGIINSLDLDSDGDGCKDVAESRGVDANNDGKLDGTGFDTTGLVVGGNGGYNGLTGNEFVAHDIIITKVPVNQTAAPGAAANFTVSANVKSSTTFVAGIPSYTGSIASTAGLTYQWYEGNPALGGVILTNTGVYTGTKTPTLNISNVTGLNGKQYFVKVGCANLVCTEMVSATLNLVSPPKITLTSKVASSPVFAVGATGQKYTVTLTVANGPTTSPLNFIDNLPAGISLSGAPVVIGGTSTGSTLSGCPTSGNTTTGCQFAAGVSNGTVIIEIPVAVAASAASATGVINTASVTGGGDPSCPTTGALAVNCSASTPVAIAVIDAINDTTSQQPGITATANLAANDVFPVGSIFTLGVGSTCVNASVTAAGIANYTSPAVAAGTCTVVYKVCAPIPNNTVCNTASLNVTARTAPDVTVNSTVASSPVFAVGATGQKYTVTLTVANGPTTSPLNFIDNLPAGISLSGAPVVIGGTSTGRTLSTCPTSGNTTTGCQFAAGVSNGTVIVEIPVTVAASAASATGAINTASVTGGGDS